MFTSPVWRLLFNQRLMVERETPRSSWTSFLGMPRSIAASVFNLRSFEYAFMGSILIQVRYLRKPLLEVRQAFIRNSSLLASVVGLYIRVGAKRMEMRRKPEQLFQVSGAEEAVAVVTLANP